jgi:DNA-binding NtrC family response regulator
MTLAKHKGNKSLTAQSLGISRKTLYEKIERYGIEYP